MTTLIDLQDSAQLNYVKNLLLVDKKPVALPTETVYGLAALANDEKSLSQIFKLKARPHFDPLIVHILGAHDIAPLVSETTALHEKLVESFWPGPLSILFKKSELVPDLCTAGTPWVALRSPSHPFFRKILESLGGLALAAPSANRFMSISPTCAMDVVTELGPFGLEAVVDGGACEKGLESTVVKIHSKEKIEIIRPGAISMEDLRSCVGGDVEIVQRSSGTGALTQELSGSPGQHSVHYAPKKPLYLLSYDELTQFLMTQKKVLGTYAVLEVFPGTLSSLAETKTRHVILSSRSSWVEAASKLFSTMRSLDDDKNVQSIIALSCPEDSLGLAIMDRLRRASQKNI